MKTKYTVLGGMAGSSMDGLDLALVEFTSDRGRWKFQLQKSSTIAYPKDIYEDLQNASLQASTKQEELDISFGNWISNQVTRFIEGASRPELLAIHGHTVVHSPGQKISWQLGHGQTIAEQSGIETATDFRSKDIKLGGQGAPLVPFGDFELFREYDACLNLGGIANVSRKEDKSAGDICPCNQVLNYYASQLGHPYDDKGELAREGNLHIDFVNQIEQLPYYHLDFPKSLPNNAIPSSVLDSVEPQVGLRSYSEFIARQVASSLLRMKTKKGQLLVTGGGAFNSFLVSLIQEKLSSYELTIPTPEIISFKEAIIFAFLGLLRQQNRINVLCSVTGASHDSSSGVIHLPK